MKKTTKKNLKGILSILTLLAIVASSFAFMGAANIEPVVDGAKVRSYASLNWNKNSHMLCAEYVWNCWKAGGYEIQEKTYSGIGSTKTGCTAQLKYLREETSIVVMDYLEWGLSMAEAKEYAREVDFQVGDLIYWSKTSNWNNVNSVVSHVAVVVKAGTGTSAKISAHNNACFDAGLWLSSGDLTIRAVVQNLEVTGSSSCSS